VRCILLRIAMTYCSKCGVSLSEGAGFCPSCGTPVVIAAPQTGYPTGGSQSTGLTSNVAAALAYVVGFITGIIFLAIGPYNKDPFVRFHAFQSIFLSVFYVAFSMVWGAIFGTLFLVSLGFLFGMIALLWSLLRLAFLLLWLFMIYKAYKNERFLLPIIGPLAAKQAAG
jgi:uncharacterized membrane protein